RPRHPQAPLSVPTRRSSDLLNGTNDINSYSNICGISKYWCIGAAGGMLAEPNKAYATALPSQPYPVDYYYPGASGQKYIYEPLRSEEHTSELQSRENLVCRL